MIHLTRDTFVDEVLNSDKVVVIDFWAEWCHPCKLLEPVFEELEKEYPQFKFCKVNTEEEPFIAQQYSIQSIPTTMFFYKGKIIKRFVGFAPKPYLKKMFDEVLKETLEENK